MRPKDRVKVLKKIMEQHKIEGRGTAEQYLILKHEAGLTNAHKRIALNDGEIEQHTLDIESLDEFTHDAHKRIRRAESRIRTLETLFAVSGAISAGILLLTLFRTGVFG